MILGIPSRPGLRVMVASKPIDFRNYVVHRIMRSPGGLTKIRAGVCRRSTPHNFGPLPAAEHGQQLVGWSEPAGPEVRRCGCDQRFEFLAGIGSQIGLGTLKAGVTKP